ncbi:hypothetical protein LTS18_010845 [Coniosporium uncinatum]|uniref:Uncharacterized protein n=1 Tax=Coniosporium uncinatum TaxID=93489 RepID=A0ACC3CZB9_9PEZI|nr:hypothetical protein LTS18_010845 [Coniosporium uncinatum]
MPTDDDRAHEREKSNFQTFRECLSDATIRKLAIQPTKPKKSNKKNKLGRKNAIKPVVTQPKSQHGEEGEQDTNNDAEDLADFTDYLASEIFSSLPPDLRLLSHAAVKEDVALKERYTDPLPNHIVEALIAPLPPSVPDSLTSYNVVPSSSDVANFLAPTLSAYCAAVTAPPPIWISTRTTYCELCLRDWIPLTYHHLIPRAVHAKALKRGWHTEDVLNSVAWLCRACHSFVHGVAGNEELAREWYTVDLLAERDDVQKWVRWVGRVRWKSR